MNCLKYILDERELMENFTQEEIEQLFNDYNKFHEEMRLLNKPYIFASYIWFPTENYGWVEQYDDMITPESLEFLKLKSWYYNKSKDVIYFKYAAYYNKCNCEFVTLKINYRSYRSICVENDGEFNVEQYVKRWGITNKN